MIVVDHGYHIAILGLLVVRVENDFDVTHIGQCICVMASQYDRGMVHIHMAQCPEVGPGLSYWAY